MTNHITPEQRELARYLKQGGDTYKSVASKIGISYGQVKQILAPSTDTRKYLLKKANGYCDCCHNKSDNLNIHHVNYVTDEIMVVCSSCHRIIHLNHHDIEWVRLSKQGYHNKMVAIPVYRKLPHTHIYNPVPIVMVEK